MGQHPARSDFPSEVVHQPLEVSTVLADSGIVNKLKEPHSVSHFVVASPSMTAMSQSLTNGGSQVAWSHRLGVLGDWQRVAVEVMTKVLDQSPRVGYEPRFHRLHHQVDLIVIAGHASIPVALSTYRPYCGRRIRHRPFGVDQQNVGVGRLQPARPQEVFDHFCSRAPGNQVESGPPPACALLVGLKELVKPVISDCGDPRSGWSPRLPPVPAYHALLPHLAQPVLRQPLLQFLTRQTLQLRAAVEPALADHDGIGFDCELVD